MLLQVGAGVDFELLSNSLTCECLNPQLPTALATFAAQSIINQHPVKGSMTASTLRSSAWNRSLKAEAILNDCEKGRQRILICQLEGHILFGNSTTTMDDIKQRLIEKPARTNPGRGVSRAEVSASATLRAGRSQAGESTGL